ncbi:hypothetical protein V3589_10960 [Sinorhizobium fredii]|uniref:hypothetical protein n=1 Tax=Rhizobium fredii TaxID=380 RepID=UPI0030A7F1D0
MGDPSKPNDEEVVTFFHCARCCQVFKAAWSVDDARAEYEITFGKPFDPGAVVVVCDDCYAEMMCGFCN